MSFLLCLQPSHKTFRIKKKLAKKMRQNRPIPHWIRLRTDNTIRSFQHSCSVFNHINSFVLLVLNLASYFGMYSSGIMLSEGTGAALSLDFKAFMVWFGLHPVMNLFMLYVDCGEDKRITS